MRSRLVVAVIVVLGACGRVGFEEPASTADAAPSPPALLVQGISASEPETTTLSVTLPAPPAPGHVLLLAGAARSGALATPTGGSAAWTRAAASRVHSNIEIWYGVADGTSTVTIAYVAPTAMSIWVGEWVGLEPTNTLDEAVATYGETSPASAGAIATHDPQELVVFAVNSFVPNAFGVPSDGPWLELDRQVDATVQIVWSRLAPTPGSIAPAVETMQLWDAAVAGFRTHP